MPILTAVSIEQIVGHGRVREVVLSDGRRLECDTVVFTGDWIPDHELARRAGLSMTAGAAAPATTAGFHTSSVGIFAIGNLVHPAETADICALDGRAAAASIVAWMADGQWPAHVAPIGARPPIAWAAHSSHGVTLRVGAVGSGRVQLLEDGKVVVTTRRRRLVPNRAIVLRGSGTGPETGAGLMEVRVLR